MKKIIYSFLLIILSLTIFIIFYLSTIGVETSKFNELIISKIKEKDSNIQLSLDKIKIKLDIKKFQVYLTALYPKIIYNNIKVPVIEINIHSKIVSILKSKNEINQIMVSLENFNIEDIQKLSVRIKPSNFKTYLLNNFSKGKIKKILINVSLDKDLNIVDYKVNGAVEKINIKIFDNLLLKDVNFNFISDKELTLINSVRTNYQGMSISNGSISLKKNKEFENE